MRNFKESVLFEGIIKIKEILPIKNQWKTEHRSGGLCWREIGEKQVKTISSKEGKRTMDSSWATKRTV